MSLNAICKGIKMLDLRDRTKQLKFSHVESIMQQFQKRKT